MTPKLKRKTIVFVVIVAVLAGSLGFVAVWYFLNQSYSTDLKILLVTGEGLQETYGYYDGSHIGNGYNFYRDEFWTESTENWVKSTVYGAILNDSSNKVRGDYSVLFDLNARYFSHFFYNQIRSRSYGYLGEEGDKWLYFSIMFNATEQITEFEVRAANYGGTAFFSTIHSDVSSYAPNEWIRFKIYMNDMASFNNIAWSEISRLQFGVQQSAASALKIWIDDIMITSTYHYNLALRNIRALFKGIRIDSRDYDKLPSNIQDYAAVVYLDNRINSTGTSLIDQYVNQGGGLILMGVSTLWENDGAERIDFPLGACPVSVLNSTETFIDNADKVDWFEDHSALKPWSNYTLFSQRGYSAYRPLPYLGIAEVYGVSLRADAAALITESGYIYEATGQYGSGKVVYFAENLAKRIANGMLETYNLQHGRFTTRGWGGATGDRLQLLESAVYYVSKHPLPKVLTVPFAKNGGFVFTVETCASIDQYWYINQSCTNIGPPSNDTAFWYTVQRMINQSEKAGVDFTLLIGTEQLVNEFRLGHNETEFDSKNLEALLAAYQSPSIEIGLYASNIKTWITDKASVEASYQNMWQGILDIRAALNVSDYEVLVWRYPSLARQGESTYGTAEAGLYLDVSDECGSVVIPYIMEAGTWKLQERRPFGGLFIYMIESGKEWSRRREETFFDWFAENDLIYHVSANDLIIAADPTHTHRTAPNAPNYTATWVQTPTFLEYVSNQSEDTWVTGGVTLAQYLRNWTNTEVSTIYESRTKTYTFVITNAPNGITVRLPLQGMHVSNLVLDVGYILKERGSYAYLALENPKSSETVKVTLGTAKLSATMQKVNAQAESNAFLLGVLISSSSIPRLLSLPNLRKELRGLTSARIHLGSLFSYFGHLAHSVLWSFYAHLSE